MKYSKLNNQELIHWIETTTEDTTKALEELGYRELEEAAVLEIATPINEQIAYERLSNEKDLTKEVKLHTSHFLTEKDIKKIYIEQLEQYIQYRQGFRFNVWNYAIGGA